MDGVQRADAYPIPEIGALPLARAPAVAAKAQDVAAPPFAASNIDQVPALGICVSQSYKIVPT